MRCFAEGPQRNEEDAGAARRARGDRREGDPVGGAGALCRELNMDLRASHRKYFRGHAKIRWVHWACSSIGDLICNAVDFN